MKRLKVEYKNADELIPYINNPRDNKEAVDAVAKSISEYGFKNPIIIDNNNVIVAGHTRLLSAKKLGMDEVPTIKADDLTPKQIRAFRIADNKTAEFAEWDSDLLKLELEDLEDTFTGFDEEAFNEAMGIEVDIEEDDFDMEPPVEPIAKRGEIYQLGKHRLMCGDSTSADDVKDLMNGKKADMMFTDPPYGVDYQGGLIHGVDINVKHKRDRLKNDGDPTIYTRFIDNLSNWIVEGSLYLFYATIYSREVFTPLQENGVDIMAVIAWIKINTGYADMNSHYKNRYEPLIYGRVGKKTNFIGDTTENTTWEMEKGRDNKMHPTQKPVKVIARAIGNHDAEIVADAFGGSGSTMIACEQLDRSCYMMELEPQYIDVIIKRWEEYTGKEAVLLKEGGN